jgi:hypothetical protein
VTNTYLPISERAKTLLGSDVVELDLTATEEKDQLDAGHLEIAPRTYKVLSNNFSAAAQGKPFEAAYPVETEAALIQGGHIERADAPVSKRK